jgi:hypothetical protein
VKCTLTPASFLAPPLLSCTARNGRRHCNESDNVLPVMQNLSFYRALLLVHCVPSFYGYPIDINNVTNSNVDIVAVVTFEVDMILSAGKQLDYIARN